MGWNVILSGHALPRFSIYSVAIVDEFSPIWSHNIRNMTTVYDPASATIHLKRSAVMQRLADYVRTGHIYYITGQTELGKTPALAEKFSRLYDTNISKQQADRARKKGRASARLFIYCGDKTPTKDSRVWWILIRTKGELSPAAGDSKENWIDYKKSGLTFQKFQLLQITKPGQKKPSYSWRFIKDEMNGIRSVIISAIRLKQNKVLQEYLDKVFAAPGFAGIREDQKKIKDLVKNEWKRSRSESEPLPKLPEVWYMRRTDDKTATARVLLSRAAKNTATEAIESELPL